MGMDNFGVICFLCDTEQDVQQYCIGCGVCMGKYFCGECKFFDDNVLKEQYHCDECGICRAEGKENFFHCNKCGCCYSKLKKDTHHCVQRAMHHNCAVCLEVFLPSLSKSIANMTPLWKKLYQEIASTPVPAIFQNKMSKFPCIFPSYSAQMPDLQLLQYETISDLNMLYYRNNPNQKIIPPHFNERDFYYNTRNGSKFWV
ncbi:hypothetical protein SLEP1_g58919 [Rubroshorea leprosula]|uniref:CTCHY-type domain-containing protein n=1 Tax=Rubroshorea leprosula TaxID=152421 RepID=A0AAV5MQX9_9ROSI|nr:hypothetical protein SLEP1_g58919 [Rubroshorea leprosula]